jgi:D-amino-acid dehydrogenase
MTAYQLARDGHQVTLIEENETSGRGASFANGGQLSYDYVAPLANPAVINKLASYLSDTESPLHFRPQIEFAQWRWCLAFLGACRAKTALETTRDLLILAHRSKTYIEEIVLSDQVKFDHRRSGKLVVYRDAAEFNAACDQMIFQTKFGTVQQSLSVDACIAIEPALTAIAPRLVGGIYTPSAEVGDCMSLSAQLERLICEKYGVTFLSCTQLQRFHTEGGSVIAAQTSRGIIEADAFVICAGVRSVSIVKTLGITLPIYPLGGYSLTLSSPISDGSPSVSITDAHHKIVYAMLGDKLRVAGMIQIGSENAIGSQRRLSLLKRQAAETFPNAGDFGTAVTWFGERPATPTGKPLIGPTCLKGLYVNTGHGTLGFTLASGSARLLADSIAGTATSIELAPFAV